FPGRGYVPQALTHGTLECHDKDASAAFYRDVLGLQIAGGGRISVYIKHPATPWYLVVLPMPKRKNPLRPVNRFTLTLASAVAVRLWIGLSQVWTMFCDWNMGSWTVITEPRVADFTMTVNWLTSEGATMRSTCGSTMRRKPSGWDMPAESPASRWPRGTASM